MRTSRLFGVNLGRLPRVAAAAAVLLPASEAGAAASHRLSVAVNAGDGYSTNPFLSAGDNPGAGFVEVEAVPRYTVTEERGEAVFEGSLRATQYLAHYGGSHAYGARMTARHSFSEALVLRGGMGAESSIVGSRSALALGDKKPSPAIVDPIQSAAPNSNASPEGLDASEGVGDEPLDPDLGLVGEEQRRNRAQAFLGLNFLANRADTIDLSIAAARSSFPNGSSAANLTTLSGNLSYSRRLSAVTQAGLSASVAHTGFGKGLGTSMVYEPQLFYSGRIVGGWSFRIGVGGVFVKSEAPGLPSRSSTGISLDLGACRMSIRLTFCFGANRGAQESGRGDVSQRTSFFTRLSYRLSPYEEIRLVSAMARTDQAIRSLVDARRQLTAEAGYRLRLRERLEIGATVGYRDLYGANRPIEGDISGRVFLSVRFER